MDQLSMRSVRAALACKYAGRRLSKLCVSFLREDRGSVAITMGIALAALMGMAALGTEVSFIQYKQRQMQAVADAAALSAALAYTKGVPADFKLEAKAIAASGGFVTGAANTVVTINRPPATGAHSANNDAIEVIIEQPQTLKLAGLFTSAQFNVGARAVVFKGESGGGFCLLSTSLTAKNTVTVNNGAHLNIDECGLAVNSTGKPALTVSGGGRITAKSVSVRGTVTMNNGGVINSAEGVLINQPAVADPYAGVNVTVPAGCNHNNLVLNWGHNNTTMMPGTYCNGLGIGNGIKVTMATGIYYIKSGLFDLGGGAHVTGTGVTIVLTKNTSSYAQATLGNGGTINLTAPKTGTTAGIVFYGDRLAPSSRQINFNGGVNMTLTGALYFPSMTVNYSNASNNSGCTQLIGSLLRFTGGAKFGTDCDGVGTAPIGGGASVPELVE
jgi:Flp pilus assembly protein TadG